MKCDKSIFFSVIFPVYNQERFLHDSLESLLAQTYQNFEVIAINDGSTDNSLGILSDYQDKIQNLIIVSQNNQGLSCARNSGLQKAIGQYIVFLDPDDIIDSHFLFNFYELIMQKEYADADLIKNTNIIKFQGISPRLKETYIQNAQIFHPTN